MNVDNFTLQQLQDGYKMKIIELQTVSQELTKCQEQLKIAEAKLQELEMGMKKGTEPVTKAKGRKPRRKAGSS